MKTVQALLTRVIVALDPREEKTSGGLFVPDTAKKPSVWGSVVSAGKKVERVKEGDRVFVTPTQGTVVNVGGKELVFLEERQVLAKSE